MKDFDALRAEREQRERSFKIAGRTFHFRPAISAQKYSAYLEVASQHATGYWPPESFDVLNGTLLECLELDSRAAWQELLSANDETDGGHPIALQDIDSIIEYVLSVQTGRPIRPLSSSGGTDGSGTTTLKAVSGSPEEPALTA